MQVTAAKIRNENEDPKKILFIKNEVLPRLFTVVISHWKTENDYC